MLKENLRGSMFLLLAYICLGVSASTNIRESIGIVPLGSTRFIRSHAHVLEEIDVLGLREELVAVNRTLLLYEQLCRIQFEGSFIWIGTFGVESARKECKERGLHLAEPHSRELLSELRGLLRELNLSMVLIDTKFDKHNEKTIFTTQKNNVHHLIEKFVNEPDKDYDRKRKIYNWTKIRPVNIFSGRKGSWNSLETEYLIGQNDFYFTNSQDRYRTDIDERHLVQDVLCMKSNSSTYMRSYENLCKISRPACVLKFKNLQDRIKNLHIMAQPRFKVDLSNFGLKKQSLIKPTLDLRSGFSNSDLNISKRVSEMVKANDIWKIPLLSFEGELIAFRNTSLTKYSAFRYIDKTDRLIHFWLLSIQQKTSTLENVVANVFANNHAVRATTYNHLHQQFITKESLLLGNKPIFSCMVPNKSHTIWYIYSLMPLSTENYKIFQLIPLPIAANGNLWIPILKDEFVALSMDFKTFFRLKENDLPNCINKECEIDYPVSQTRLSTCGIAQLAALPDRECVFQKYHRDIFLESTRVGIFISSINSLHFKVECESQLDEGSIHAEFPGSGLFILNKDCTVTFDGVSDIFLGTRVPGIIVDSQFFIIKNTFSVDNITREINFTKAISKFENILIILMAVTCALSLGTCLFVCYNKRRDRCKKEEKLSSGTDTDSTGREVIPDDHSPEYYLQKLNEINEYFEDKTNQEPNFNSDISSLPNNPSILNNENQNIHRVTADIEMDTLPPPPILEKKSSLATITRRRELLRSNTYIPNTIDNLDAISSASTRNLVRREFV